MSNQPLVTFAVLAYRQERFVREAVEAALAQTWTPLEVILSDDGSPDGTFRIMQEVAAAHAGPHRIVLNRNRTNLGIGGHINRVMDLATGDFIVLAAGDDVSLPERTSVLVERWLADPERIACLFSDLEMISETGETLERLPAHMPPHADDIAAMARHGGASRGASQAWPRATFDRFGPFLPQLVQEDVALTFRALLAGRIACIPTPLVRWRVGTSSWAVRPNEGSQAMIARAHTERSARHQFVNAVQALMDVERANRSDLVPHVTARLREAELQVRLATGGSLSLGDLVAAVADGADLRQLLKTALKGQAGPVAEWALALKKALFRRGTTPLDTIIASQHTSTPGDPAS